MRRRCWWLPWCLSPSSQVLRNSLNETQKRCKDLHPRFVMLLPCGLQHTESVPRFASHRLVQRPNLRSFSTLPTRVSLVHLFRFLRHGHPAVHYSDHIFELTYSNSLRSPQHFFAITTLFLNPTPIQRASNMDPRPCILEPGRI